MIDIQFYSLSQTSLKLPPTITEIYIPLWSADGTSINTNSVTYQYVKDGGAVSSTITSETKLFTLNANWDANLQFAFESTIAVNSAANTGSVSLVNITDNINVASSVLTMSSTTFVVMRSSQFSLIPGKIYGVSIKSGNTSYTTQLSDASLIIFGS